MSAMMSDSFASRPARRTKKKANGSSIEGAEDVVEAGPHVMVPLTEDDKAAWRQWQRNSQVTVENHKQLDDPMEWVEWKARAIFEAVVKVSKKGCWLTTFDPDTTLACSARLEVLIDGMTKYSLVRLKSWEDINLEECASNPKAFIARSVRNCWGNWDRKSDAKKKEAGERIRQGETATSQGQPRTRRPPTLRLALRLRSVAVSPRRNRPSRSRRSVNQPSLPLDSLLKRLTTHQFLRKALELTKVTLPAGHIKRPPSGRRLYGYSAIVDVAVWEAVPGAVLTLQLALPD
jgi:hypothetical protein